MKRLAIVVAAFAGLVAGCGVDTFAPPTGGAGRFILKGKVTNLTGTLLQNVTVQVQPLGGGPVIRTMLTGQEGAYRTFGLAAGIYRVIVVMGDSSRITATGRSDVYVGPNADSTIVPNLTYDPGKVISGSLTYSVQTPGGLVSVPLRGVRVWLNRRTATAPAPGVFTRIDSVRTSATGAYRFAIRVQSGTGSVLQLQFNTKEPAVFPPNPIICPGDSTCFRAAIDTAIADTQLIDTVRVTNATLTPSGGVINATSAASNSLTFAAPYVIRARVFKDRNGDGAYSAADTLVGSPTVVNGVRFWLRVAGSTVNLGSGTQISSAVTTTAGNILFTGLKNGTTWTLHMIAWYLPTGCTIEAGFVLTAEGDIAVTPDFRPFSTSAQTVATKDIPLTCP